MRWQRLSCPFEAARALSEGTVLEALKEAKASFDALGARPAALSVTHRLRELGARGILRGPRRATLANPAKLTVRELDVLELNGEGLSNPEIAVKLQVSAKTVEHHVSAMLAKLGARNRSEAIRQATRLSILNGDRPTAR